MSYLLDTHVWFWALQTPEKLGTNTRALLGDPDNTLMVSAISTLEFGQLLSVGRIQLKGTLEAWIRHGTEILQLQPTDVSHAIAILAYNLPGEFHKDPADRILVATAIDLGLTLITADERILAYPHVLVFDARQ